MSEEHLTLKQLRNRYERYGGAAVTFNRIYELDSFVKIELKDYSLFLGVVNSYIITQGGLEREFWLEYFKRGDLEKSGSIKLEQLCSTELPIGANIDKCEESLQAQVYQVGKNEAILNFYSRSIREIIRMYFVSLCPVLDKISIQELKGGERK